MAKTDHQHLNILLIEDNPGDARLIEELLSEAARPSFELAVADRLASGLEHLGAGTFDLVLLDLSLPDSQGLDTLNAVRTHTRHVPIVLLTGLVDEELAVEAVRQGAQDYLVKGQVDSNLLGRSLRYSIERHRLQTELRSLSLTDDLTGLYNRRGFLILCEQQLRLAGRTKARQLLFFADVDGLKQINDIFGHQEGDRALMDTANILRRTFRQSDIITRLGGDEYAVLAIDGHNGIEPITARLNANLKVFQEKMNRPYTLSLSMGVAVYDPQRPCSMDELLAKADESMYARKRHKQGKGQRPDSALPGR